ncbi:hypothetical protein BHE74_00011268 [Ensete ventricosum]|nr:hypothetical protein BHE74_00011268 [Ensete ventricosum]
MVFSTYLQDERMQTKSQNRGIELCKGQTQLSTCHHPLEVPESPHQALEFLSRTWSPSSSDFFQLLSPSVSKQAPPVSLHFLITRNPSMSMKQRRTIPISPEMPKQEWIKSWYVSSVCLLMQSTLTEGSLMFILTRNPQIDVGQMKAWLGGEILSSFSRGCRKRRKEELRLHTAQVHATLSVARLAAAIAGIVGNCYLEPINSKAMSLDHQGRELDNRMNTVVASAAALVATVCAEAAESVGTNRTQVASAIRTGLATRSSADLVTLTATAATCLRGAATLELRAAACRQISEDQNTLARGAELPIQTPDGNILLNPINSIAQIRIQLRMVRIYVKHDRLALRLGKKHIRGVISTYKEFRVFYATEDPKGGFSKNGHGCYLITLATTGGTIQLLFEDHKRYIMWKSSISHLLCDYLETTTRF